MAYLAVCDVTPTAARRKWTKSCAVRIQGLSPSMPEGCCSALAEELWAVVGSYDPVLAAEMEFESGGFN